MTCPPAAIPIQLSNSEQICVRVLAARCARALLRSRPRKQEGAGKAGCALHPRSRVQLHKRVRTRAYRSSGEHPTFPAQWFYGLYAISPVSRALLPPSSLRYLLLRNLAPASGARTTRFRRTLEPRASSAAPASTASHRAFVTIATRPSHRVRRAEYGLICCFGKSEYFFRRGLTYFRVICPSC